MTFAVVRATTQIDSTMAVTTTIPVVLSLGGLVPKVVIATAINRIDETAGVADVQFSVGFATSTTLLYSIATASQNGVTPSNAARSISKAALLHAYTPGGVASGLCGISNMTDPDYFELRIDQQFGSSFKVDLMIFAGTEFSDATIIEYTKTSLTTGPVSVTTPGFPVKFAMALSTLSNAIPAAAATGVFACVGRALPATPANHMLAWVAIDNVNPSDTSIYHIDTEFLCEPGATAIGYRAAITGQLPTGFTLNEIENSSSQLRKFAILCLGGSFQAAFATFVSKTDTTTDIQPSAGFPISLASLWSGCRVKSTTDTPQATAEVSVASYAPPSAGLDALALGFIDRDALAATVVATVQRTGKVYTNLSTAGAIEGEMVPGADPVNALGLIMSDADPTENAVTAAMFGAAPAAPPGGILIQDMIGRRSPIPWPR